MSLQSIKTNLENTIYGKEQFLVRIQSDELVEPGSNFALALNVMIQVLELNISELKNILEDVNSSISEQSSVTDRNSNQRMEY